MQGNAPHNAAFDALATGPVKVVALPAGMSPGDFQQGLINQDPSVFAALQTAPARLVTPDPNRRTANPTEWAGAHLTSPTAPHGHGISPANAAAGILYYTFQIAPGVVGISLDTCNRGGYADGTIFQTQLVWLEQQLQSVSSRYISAAGTEVRTSANDQLVVLFSHHNLLTLDNPVPDPNQPGVPPVSSAQVRATILRYPNVVAWVNGHNHVNRVYAHPDPTGLGGGFWEILTAAHVDYPEHARIVEIADNRDGTLSIFATLIESAAQAAPTGAYDVLDLASISRELSFNDFQHDPFAALGAATDRNVELLIRAPFGSKSKLSVPLVATGDAPQDSELIGASATSV